MFIEKLRLSKRLILAFLCMAFLVAVVGFFSLSELKRVTVPLTEEIPSQLNRIKKTADTDTVVQKILGYNQVLTESARTYIQQYNREHKLKYREFESRLDAGLRQLNFKGNRWLEDIALTLEKNRKIFVTLEQRAISLRDTGKTDEAMALLESESYWNSKRQFRQALDQYIERRGNEYDQSLVIAINKIEAMLQSIKQVIDRSLHMLFLLILVAIFIAVFLGVYVSRSIVRPIRSLHKGAKLVEKGVLDHRIEIDSKDEIGELAEQFNSMTTKLGEFYGGLETKVREKTKELALKVKQIQQQNQALENTQEAMLNVLEDLEQAKAIVEQEKAKDEAILASVGDGLIATDRDGNIMMMNNQAEIMLGVKAADALHQSYEQIVKPFDRDGTASDVTLQPLYRSLQCAKKITNTTYFKHSKQGLFPAAVTASPIVKDRQIIGAIATFRDITKEKEVDRMKTEFISIVSHELKTPLTVIREGVCLVLDKLLGPTTVKQEKFLQLALDDIDRLTRIINDLLDVSRIEAGKVDLKRRYVVMEDVVRSIMQNFEARMQAKHIEFKTNFPNNAQQVFVDPDKMTQVFTNLIGNAFKFTENGHIEIGIEQEDQEYVCYVRDTGCGISKEDMNRVFGKFQQFGKQEDETEKGTGLGLSIAKAIVELHQGRIWVDSEPGKGTCFTFKIPIFSPREIFDQQVTWEIGDAYKHGKVLTLFSMDLSLELIQKFEEKGQKTDVMEAMIRKVLIDMPLLQMGPILASQEHSDFMIIGLERRGLDTFVDCLKKNMAKFLKKDQLTEEDIHLRSVCFPDDGSTEEELMDHLKVA